MQRWSVTEKHLQVQTLYVHEHTRPMTPFLPKFWQFVLASGQCRCAYATGLPQHVMDSLFTYHSSAEINLSNSHHVSYSLLRP